MRRWPIFVGTARVGRAGSIRSFSSVVTLWLLCDHVPPRAVPAGRADPARKPWGLGPAGDRLAGVRDGCVQGLGGDVTRRSQPPACGVAHRERPRPRAPVESPGAAAPSRCPLVCAASGAHRRLRCVPDQGRPAPPWRFFGGTDSSDHPGPGCGRRRPDGSGAGRVGTLAAMVLVLFVRRAPVRPASAGAGRG